MNNDTVSTRTFGNTIQSRFPLPENYFRIVSDSNRFSMYLRNLKLKPEGSLVNYFNGESKSSENIYAAVIDMEITAKDLQQCADAVMRLRGEYLYSQKMYSSISFRFLGDGKMHDFLSYSGNDTSYKIFRKYMDHVFNYANTASLYKQLKPRNFSDMQIGDVFIQTGNPYGHAVMVVDMCRNKQNEFQFMLAQSYMPAQETQILLNPSNQSVWYPKSNNLHIETPQWTFDSTDLRTW